MGDIHLHATTHHHQRYKQNHTSPTQIIEIYTYTGLGIPPVEDSASWGQGGGMLGSRRRRLPHGFETAEGTICRQ